MKILHHGKSHFLFLMALIQKIHVWCCISMKERGAKLAGINAVGGMGPMLSEWKR